MTQETFPLTLRGKLTCLFKKKKKHAPKLVLQTSFFKGQLTFPERLMGGWLGVGIIHAPAVAVFGVCIIPATSFSPPQNKSIILSTVLY